METLSLPKTRSNGSQTTNGRSHDSALDRDVIERKVRDWIVYCFQTKHDPPLSRPLTTHLDALLDTEIAPENLVRVSFETYQVLKEQMAQLGISETIMPTLRIPLEMSETLIAGPVEAETLISQITSPEPPSLYLLERTFKTKMNVFEHYIFPLRAAYFLEDTGRDFVYYSTSRSREDIRNNWEYGRDIVAEYYPEAYHNTL